MNIKEVMRKPVCVEKDVSIKEAVKIMSSKNIGSLLFVFKGNLKGIITESDILKAFGKKTKISEIASNKVYNIEQDEELADAFGMMREKKVKHLAVTAKSKLVGIISITDILANWDEIETEGVGEHFFIE